MRLAVASVGDEPVALHFDNPVRRVAARLSHGPTARLVAAVRDQTPSGWIEAQLDPESIDDHQADVAVAGFTLTHLAPGTVQSAGIDVEQLRREVRVAALLRAVHSERQLFEVMVEFWRNHFSVDIRSHWAGLASGHYEYAVIRPHALGRFSDLLAAVASAPTMLAYLDNASSRLPNVNENFARELLELHTVGVNGGYGEQDVRMAAAAFSGWSFATSDVTFVFRAEHHDTRALRVMDFDAPAGNGVERGQRLLAHLARHPATAHRLATKLASWLLGAPASPAMVNRAAKAYLVQGTDITAMLRALLTDPDAFSPSSGSKIRQPFSLLASWLRATGADTETSTGGQAAGSAQLERALYELGQTPWGWPTPDGHPDDDDHWSGSGLLIGRWRMATRLIANGINGVRVDVAPLVGGASHVGELVDRLAAVLLSARLDAGQRGPLVAFGGGEDARIDELDDARLRQLCALVLLLPAALRR